MYIKAILGLQKIPEKAKYVKNFKNYKSEAWSGEDNKGIKAIRKKFRIFLNFQKKFWVRKL